MMPVPSHLRGLVVPLDDVVDEEALAANIRCSCGETVFELLYPGQTHEYDGETVPSTAEVDGRFFFLLKSRCVNCTSEHLLFDADFHGWDGFICHDSEKAAVARPPLVAWTCQQCAGTHHTGVIRIQTEGRDDFVSESGGTVEANRWPDAFGWFSLDVTCSGCGKISPDFVSYETM